MGDAVRKSIAVFIAVLMLSSGLAVLAQETAVDSGLVEEVKVKLVMIDVLALKLRR